MTSEGSSWEMWELLIHTNGDTKPSTNLNTRRTTIGCISGLDSMPGCLLLNWVKTKKHLITGRCKIQQVSISWMKMWFFFKKIFYHYIFYCLKFLLMLVWVLLYSWRWKKIHSLNTAVTHFTKGFDTFLQFLLKCDMLDFKMRYLTVSEVVQIICKLFLFYTFCMFY